MALAWSHSIPYMSAFIAPYMIGQTPANPTEKKFRLYGRRGFASADGGKQKIREDWAIINACQIARHVHFGHFPPLSEPILPPGTGRPGLLWITQASSECLTVWQLDRSTVLTHLFGF